MSARIAVVSDAPRLRAWEASCVDALTRAGCTIVACVVADRGSPPFGDPASLRPAQDDPTLPPPRDPEAARGAGADIALAFDNALVPAARALGAAQTWSFSFGGGRPDEIAGARELCAGEGAVRAALVAHGSHGDTSVKRGWFGVVAHSYEQTIDGVRFGAARWPAEVMRERAVGLSDRAEPFAAAPRDGSAAPRSALERHLAGASVRARRDYLFRHEHWNVGIVDRPIASFLARSSVEDARWLPAPARGTFIADPFGYADDGATYLFCEGYSYTDRTGYLASGAIDDQRANLAPFLRLPVHLSYPFIVRDGDGVFCIPEMSQSGEIALYRATRLPATWVRVGSMIAFAGCDPSVVRHDGRWWLFCTHADAPNHELHVFHADALAGPWVAHARNPVKVDVRSSRPAGTPFVHDGALHRPAQDCAGGYGRRVVLNRVLALTPSEFDEEPVAHIAPDPSGPYPEGVHTLSAAGDRTLIDGKRYRFVPSEFWSVARGYASRVLRAGRA